MKSHKNKGVKSSYETFPHWKLYWTYSRKLLTSCFLREYSRKTNQYFYCPKATGTQQKLKKKKN